MAGVAPDQKGEWPHHQLREQPPPRVGRPQRHSNGPATCAPPGGEVGGGAPAIVAED